MSGGGTGGREGEGDVASTAGEEGGAVGETLTSAGGEIRVGGRTAGRVGCTGDNRFGVASAAGRGAGGEDVTEGVTVTEGRGVGDGRAGGRVTWTC